MIGERFVFGTGCVVSRKRLDDNVRTQTGLAPLRHRLYNHWLSWWEGEDDPILLRHLDGGC